MRIAHFVPVLDQAGSYGGPAAVCEILCDELAGRGHQVSVVGTRATTSRPWRPESPPPWELRVFRGHRAVATRQPGALLSVGALWWFLRSSRHLDCLHLHGVREPMSVALMLLCIATRTRYVVQAHGMLERPRWVPGWDPLCSAVLRRADLVLALTQDEADTAMTGRGCSRVVVLANPAPPPTTTPLRLDYVLACSRVHPRKRLGLFTAMADLVRQQDDQHFVVVGPPEGDEGVVERAVARHPGSFAWVGGVPGPAARQWIADAAVLVVTAENEPFGMTIVEALAAGTPVLGTWDLALAPSLSEAGAIVVVDADPAALADALVRMLADPDGLARQVAAGRRWVDDNSSVAVVADRVVAAYRGGPQPGGPDGPLPSRGRA